MGFEFPNQYANPLRHFAPGTGSTPGALTSLLLENTLWIAKNGTVGVRNDASKPFPTFTAALAAAVAGDSIFVFPGDYTETIAVTVPVKIYFLGANLIGQLFAFANLELYNAVIDNQTALGSCVRIDASGVTVKTFGGSLTSIQNGLSYNSGVNSFTYELENTRIVSSDDCVQFAGIVTADNVKLKAKNCYLESLLQPLELAQAQFDIDGGIISNKNSVGAITPVDYNPRGVSGLQGSVRNALIIGSATATTAAANGSLSASETINFSNCQSDKTFPFGAGYLINNCLEDSAFTII